MEHWSVRNVPRYNLSINFLARYFQLSPKEFFWWPPCYTWAEDFRPENWIKFKEENGLL